MEVAIDFEAQGQLKTGEEILIRLATAEDAPAIFKHVKRIVDNDDTVLRYPEEFSMTEKTTLAWIEGLSKDSNSVILVAYHGDRFVGMLDGHGGSKIKERHKIEFGMSVRAEYRDQGVGRQLVMAFIEWVRMHPTLEKIVLSVFSNNPGAYFLYRSLGFEEEGLIKESYKTLEDTYIDEIRMGLRVK